MIETVLASLGLLICGALLLRMALSPQRQRRWDGFWRRQLGRVRSYGRWLARQWRLLRSSRRAQRAAGEAIERARRAEHDVDREGNVIKPRSFRGSTGKKPPLH